MTTETSTIILLLTAALALHLLAQRIRARRDPGGLAEARADRTREQLGDHRVGIEGRVAALEATMDQVVKNQEKLATQSDVNQLKQLVSSSDRGLRDLFERLERKSDRLEEYFIQEGLKRR